MSLRPVLALLAIFSAGLASLFGASAKPNIVYILADDLGFAELGCNGSDRYKTPNIDALANSGVRFTRFYTVPLCGPSRAMILTGRYGFQTTATLPDGRVLNDLRRVRKDNSGYALRHLFLGGEGTLGIITAAALRLFPRPASTATALLAVSSPEAALHELLTISAELESLAVQFSFRFGATAAYEAIVNQRIGVLREERFGGAQTFGEFMMRRYDPAMRTVKSAEKREPVNGLLVALYTADSPDSVMYQQKPFYFTKTDKNGDFFLIFQFRYP